MAKTKETGEQPGMEAKTNGEDHVGETTATGRTKPGQGFLALDEGFRTKCFNSWMDTGKAQAVLAPLRAAGVSDETIIALASAAFEAGHGVGAGATALDVISLNLKSVAERLAARRRDPVAQALQELLGDNVEIHEVHGIPGGFGHIGGFGRGGDPFSALFGR